VQRAVAAHEDHSPAGGGAGPQRLEEIVLGGRHDRIGLRAVLLGARRQVGRRAQRVLDAARARVDHKKQARRTDTFRLVVIAELTELDRGLMQAIPVFETPLLTSLCVLLSAWWVKGPLLVGLGFACDVGRRRPPLAFIAALVATLSASLVVSPLKELFDRDRPPEADPGLGSLVPIPGNASFPSGHSATAFAAATAVAIISPRMRPYALGLAAAVALSRVYLRVHFPLDVLAGGLIGAALGALAALMALRLVRRGPPLPA